MYVCIKPLLYSLEASRKKKEATEELTRAMTQVAEDSKRRRTFRSGCAELWQ
jgi:hypothetical protein